MTVFDVFETDLETLITSIVKSKVDITANCHTTIQKLPEIRERARYILYDRLYWKYMTWRARKFDHQTLFFTGSKYRVVENRYRTATLMSQIFE